MTFEEAETACCEQGLTPYRLPFASPLPWRESVSYGQVQSVETYGPGTFNHPKFCEEITELS